MAPLRVEVQGIDKAFSGVPVLRNVNLTLPGGGVHALVGENGAGKSTLVSILAGANRPDHGHVVIDGVPMVFRSPLEARRFGVTLVSQELTLVPRRTVAENVLAGRWPTLIPGIVSRSRLTREYERIAERCSFDLPATALVDSLNQAQQECVEIMRAVGGSPRVLILDEPTTAMSPDQSALVMRLARSLAEQGTCVVLISHDLDDVLRHCDTVSVLRDGQVVGTRTPTAVTKASLIEDMIGRPLGEQIPEKPPMPDSAQPVLSARGVSRGALVRDVGITVRPGEIVGIAGLVGSGRTEFARCLVGADRMDAGEIIIDGDPVRIKSVREAKALGIVMIPENRKQQGLHLDHSVERNITLPHLSRLSRWGLIRRRASNSEATSGIQTVAVKSSLHRPVRTLSGGNQQRVLFAKWIAAEPRVLIADEPTRGVDVAGKRAIYEIVTELARQGTAVIVISSELPEVIGLSHRVLVMRQGAVAGEFVGDTITESNLTRAAFGLTTAAAED